MRGKYRQISLKKFSKDRRVSLKAFLYYGAWILFSTVYIVYQQSEFAYYSHASSIYKVASYLTILILFSCIFVDSQFRIKELYIYAFLMILMSLIYLNYSNRTFLVYMLFIWAFKFTNFEQLIKLDLKLKTVLLLFILSMCFIGVIDDYSSVWGSGIVKHAYGFYHPNTLGIICFSILIEWLYLRYKKMKMIEWLAILAIAYLMYHIAASRTASYTFMVVYWLFVIAQKWPYFFKLKLVKGMLIILTPLFAVLSWGGLFLYINGNAVAQAINTFTTQRLRYAANFYSEYGVSIFGRDVEFVSSRSAQLQGISSEILDMSYIRGPILFGIVFSVLVFVGYMILIKNCLNAKQDCCKIGVTNIGGTNIGLVIFTIYYVILGLGESYLLNPIYCVPMVLILNVFTGVQKKKNKDKKARV